MTDRTKRSIAKSTLLYASIVTLVVVVAWVLFMMMASIFPRYEGAGFDFYDFELVEKKLVGDAEVETVLQKKCVVFNRDRYQLADVQKDFLANSDIRLTLDDTWALKGISQEESINKSLQASAKNQELRVTKMDSCKYSRLDKKRAMDKYPNRDVVVYR